MISMIVAHDPHLVIGKDGKIPWHYSEDLKYFKKITLGSTVVMGRKTFESIGKALPGRKNIVLSSKNNIQAKDIQLVSTFSEIEKIAAQEDLFIIGGSSLYDFFLSQTDRLYITEIKSTFPGDTFFPEYRENLINTWKLIYEEPKEDFCFKQYQRV